MNFSESTLGISEHATKSKRKTFVSRTLKLIRATFELVRAYAEHAECKVSTSERAMSNRKQSISFPSGTARTVPFSDHNADLLRALDSNLRHRFRRFRRSCTTCTRCTAIRSARWPPSKRRRGRTSGRRRALNVAISAMLILDEHLPERPQSWQLIRFSGCLDALRRLVPLQKSHVSDTSTPSGTAETHVFSQRKCAESRKHRKVAKPVDISNLQLRANPLALASVAASQRLANFSRLAISSTPAWRIFVVASVS